MKKETKETLISFGIAVIIFSVFLGFLLVMGCATTKTQLPDIYTQNTTEHLIVIWADGYGEYGNSNSGTIAKIFIPEDNVTCYTFDNYNGGGISCLAE